MEKMSPEELKLLLEKAGLKLTAEDQERLRLLFEKFQGRLSLLREADLGEEEVAGIFPPQGDLG